MGDEDWTLNQAIEFIAYADPQRARKAPEYISEREWPPSALMSYWPPQVTAAVWGLWQGLEDGVITATERGRPVPTSRWSVDRLSRLAPDEQIPLGPFIREIQRSVTHVRIPATRLSASPPQPPAEPATPPKVEAPHIAPNAPVEDDVAPLASDKTTAPRKSHKATLAEDTRARLRELFPNGFGPRDSHKVVANRLGVSVSTVKRALKGVDWLNPAQGGSR